MPILVLFSDAYIVHLAPPGSIDATMFARVTAGQYSASTNIFTMDSAGCSVGLSIWRVSGGRPSIFR